MLKLNSTNQIYSATGINFKSKVNNEPEVLIVSKPDSFEISSDEHKNAPRNKKKWSFGNGFRGGGNAVGIALLTKGRKNPSAQKVLVEVPESLNILFSKIYKEEGEAFVNKAYSELVEYMGLKDVAPKKVHFDPGEGNGAFVTGGYHPARDAISYTENFLTELTKEEQFRFLAHELKHCEQFYKVLRTEGLGVEKYVRAEAEKAVEKATTGRDEGGSKNALFESSYKKALEVGRGEEFLQLVVEKTYQKNISCVKHLIDKVEDLPKIKSNSEDGLKAKEYLEAIRNYEWLSFSGTESESYYNNLLEIEAYSFGNKMEELFSSFMENSI